VDQCKNFINIELVVFKRDLRSVNHTIYSFRDVINQDFIVIEPNFIGRVSLKPIINSFLLINAQLMTVTIPSVPTLKSKSAKSNFKF